MKKKKCFNTGRTWFKKGHIPWNKGIKGAVNSGSFKKGHKFCFKKGHKPHNKGIKGYTNKGSFKSGHNGNSVFDINHRSWLKGKKWPESLRKKLSGKNAGNWQGGKTKENQLLRNKREAIIWRIAVFERDNYTCQICGQRGGKLNADHKKPWSKYPELRYSIDNGRTLCVECHRNTDTYGGKIFARKELN